TEPRFGLYRAQVVFEHPILYGAFCASAFGLVYYVQGHQGSSIARQVRSGIVGLAVVFSVSTGALTSLIAQMFLMAWNYATRRMANRWKILGLLFLIAYVAVD